MADRRAILEKVAAGELSPADAAALLADEAPNARADEAPIAAVKLTGSFRTITVIGDPTVREAVASGDHSARREGDAFVIEADEHVEGEGVREFRFSNRDKRVVLGVGSKPLPLEVRMNPALALDAQLAAGTLKVKGVRGPIRAQVSAGSIRIEGFASPVELQVAGGTINASGVLDRGASRIQCEAGSVKVSLEPGSSVRIKGKAGLGKVVLPGADGDTTIIGGGARESVVGGGAGSLDVEASMGKIVVEAP